MSSASMKPQHVAPALTVTISSSTSISFNPSSAQVASGGVVSFASANSTAWEVELFNKDNNEAHAMRLYVPASGSSEMIAAPMNSPREVHFNIMAYSGAKPNKTGTSGTYKITITSGPVGGE
jgi:phosphopantothenate synthetase